MLKIIDKIIVSDQAPKGKNVLWLQPSEKGYQIKVNSGGGYTTLNNGSTEEHEYVDLGLPSGTLWATCNVGAKKPEELGNKYAWGETKVKVEYTDENYSLKDLTIPDISGNSQYDTARVHWGGSWRMPTIEEIEELVNNITAEYIVYNQVHSVQVTGPNGNSIILSLEYSYFNPYEQYANIGYWGSTSHKNNLQNAELLVASKNLVEEGFTFSKGSFPEPKYQGLYIRPVKSK